MSALGEIDESPLAILLFHEKNYFPLCLDWAIEEGFADLVLFLSEADKLRGSETDTKVSYTGYSRIYETYFCKSGGVMDCVKKYGIPHTRLKEMIECRIPAPTMFATLCDCIWKEIMIRLKELPKSVMWASVRRAVIEDKRTTELINILSHAYSRKFYEDFIADREDEVVGLNCWLEVYTVTSFVQARTNGVPMPGTYCSKNDTQGEQLKKALDDLYFDKEPHDSRKHAIHERFKMAQNSAVANSAAGGGEWYVDSKLVFLLTSARDIHKAYFPTNAADTKQPYPAGLSKSTRLEFTSIIRAAQGVRVCEIESVDEVFAAKLMADLQRVLGSVQTEIFRHLQSLLPAFFESVQYVMMVATNKIIWSPSVNEYFQKMSFLDGEVSENIIVRWNHPRSKGMTHISCMKRLTSRSSSGLADGKLRDIYIQFAPTLASQIRALRRSRPASCLTHPSSSEVAGDKREMGAAAAAAAVTEFSMALLLCSVPLHVLVQSLFMLLMGKAMIFVGYSETHLKQILCTVPHIVRPFDLEATHHIQYFSKAADFSAWISSSYDNLEAAAGAEPPHISYLLGVSHQALSGISVQMKCKLVVLFSRAHLLSSGRSGSNEPLSKSYCGDFPADDNNLAVFDVDLGEVFFHHREDSSHSFANTRSEKAEVLMNHFSVRKFQSKAFECLQRDLAEQYQALKRVRGVGKNNNSTSSSSSGGGGGGGGGGSDRFKGLLSALVERSNRLVELAFVRYLSNVILRFLPIHLYNFPKQSVAICDVKSVLADIIDAHAARSDLERADMALGSGSRLGRTDSVRVSYGISDFEIGFASDLITGSRPSFVELLNRGGLYLMQQAVK